MKTAELLRQRLQLVYPWYRGMANPDTGMLKYLYLPQSNNFISEKSPIQDIPSIWDLEMLSYFLNRDEFRSLIGRSL